jgi:hypothetical protein
MLSESGASQLNSGVNVIKILGVTAKHASLFIPSQRVLEGLAADMEKP